MTLVAGEHVDSASACAYRDGTGGDARFGFVPSMAVAPDGAVYVLERYYESTLKCSIDDLPRIRRVDAQGVVTTVVACPQSNGADPARYLRYPTSIAIGKKGELYVGQGGSLLDGGHTLGVFTIPGMAGGVWRVLSPTRGEVLAGIATPSSQQYLDGTGEQAVFTAVNAMAMDANGDLYTMEWWNGALRRVSPQGVVTSVAGFSQPNGQVLADPKGTVFVAQLALPDVRLVNPRTQEVVVITNPNGSLCLASDGMVYINRGTGVYRRRKGGGDELIVGAASKDDPDSAVRLTRLYGVSALAVAPDGMLYILDRHALLRFDPNGV
ncbi:MAG TPA: hypothetical protein VGC24_05220 [Burkholderiaceae bacterium]